VTDWKEVGRRIATRRNELGWTQPELGSRVGDSKTQVALLEGGRAVREERLSKYAEVLGLSMAYLRYGVAAEKSQQDAYDRGRRDGISATRLAIEAALIELAQPKALTPITSAVEPQYARVAKTHGLRVAEGSNPDEALTEKKPTRQAKNKGA
jgi:transcriptional regulator with XRE-family HTH domain